MKQIFICVDRTLININCNVGEWDSLDSSAIALIFDLLWRVLHHDHDNVFVFSHAVCNSLAEVC